MTPAEFRDFRYRQRHGRREGSRLVMTPAEFCAARKALGLTQAQMAQALGMGDQEMSGRVTVGRYETGTRSISGPVAMLVRIMLDGRRPADWPDPVGA